METIYKGRAINIEWEILRGNSCLREDFSRARVKVLLGYESNCYPHWVGEGGTITITDNVLHIALAANTLAAGTYTIKGIWVKNEGNLQNYNYIDRCICQSQINEVFAITDIPSEDTGAVSVTLKTSAATYGYDGLNAYELAVLREETTHNEATWLNELLYTAGNGISITNKVISVDKGDSLKFTQGKLDVNVVSNSGIKADNNGVALNYDNSTITLDGNYNLSVKDNGVSVSKIAANAVTTAKIADGNVTRAKIADGSINTAKIADDAVTTDEIADGSITAAKLNGGCVTTDWISNNAVTTAKINDGAVTTDKIADGAITNTLLAEECVEGVNIQDEAIGNTHLQDDSVGTSNIIDGNVTTEKIEDGAISSAKINDGAVTTAKINDGAVTTAKINNSAVTAAKIDYSNGLKADANDKLTIKNGDGIIVDSGGISLDIEEDDFRFEGTSLVINDEAIDTEQLAAGAVTLPKITSAVQKQIATNFANITPSGIEAGSLQQSDINAIVNAMVAGNVVSISTDNILVSYSKVSLTDDGYVSFMCNGYLYSFWFRYGSANKELTFSNKIKLGSLDSPVASAPSTTTSTGVMGQYYFSQAYLYICVDNNTWRRVALSTW